NAGDSKLMLLGIHLLLPVLVNVVRHKLTTAGSVNAVRLNLVLLVQVNAVEGDFINTSIEGFFRSLYRFQSLLYPLIINPNSISLLIIKNPTSMAALKFASSHNIVAFLDKPTESDGFEQIVDFLNARPIKYALTVNPAIYTSCIEQFWATAKVKTVNGEVQI
ncbi:hypothetical protein Tco_0882757, partial [Tanacetum coccineum]